MTLDLVDFESYLDAARIPLRLSCITESGWPMSVSLWFHYQDGRVFCATQKSARVVSYLQNEPRCGFEIAADLPPYCGVRGQAIATIDDETGVQVLEQLLVRYLGGTNNRLARTLLSKRETEVAIILKPVRTFTWDFSSRMADVAPTMADRVRKVCP